MAHGGPAGAFVNGFRLGGLEGGQVWAGKGWAVFYPNPRGSSNYGQKTLAANVNDWGGGDYRDIMTGVDALIARGISDPDKLAHIGWSYGGYMTAWVITQTNRFKAAMVGAGLTNEEIAERLYMSPATSKTHVSRAMIKLGARDRAQLVVFAYESGLVRPGWSG